MTKRRVLWSLAGLLMLVALALLIPSSPAYAPKLVERYVHQHDGHGTGYWMDALDSPDAQARRKAVHSLGMIGTDAEEAVPALAAVMREDPDVTVRIEASLALFRMAPASRSAVPALAEALGDDEPLVRMNAANTLFRLRTDARAAVPALIEAARAPENGGRLLTFGVTIREVATLALGRASAGTAEAVPALTQLLEAAETGGMRRAAVRALGDVGADARPAAPQLRALLTQDDSLLREAAEEALRKIGDEAAPAG
jgi:HEAT repeat protein